jgi:superfamily II DNA or RNA helicase
MCFNIEQLSLLDHQQEALDFVIEELQNGKDRVLFSMCTGSGKTRVILKIPHEMDWERVVYIFPTLSLVEQFKNDYIIKYNITNVKLICSLKESKSEIEVDTHEYITDDKELYNKLKDNTYTLITTYASLEKVLKSIKKNKQDCNLIFDEAHHETAKNCQEILETYSEHIENQVLATATFDDKEQDEICYNYPFSQAVDDGICRDFDIYVQLRKKGQERDMIKDLQEIKRKTGNSKCMVFTQYSNDNEIENKNNVEQFFKIHKDSVKKNNGWIEKITAGTKMKERKNILNKFDENSNEYLSLLVSCKTIGEGVDTKNANMVLFADSTKSVKDIIQKIGRAVRIYRHDNGNIKEDQPHGSIVVFIYVDEDKYKNCVTKEDCDKVIRDSMHDNGDFSTIFNVMVALKQTDEDMYKRCICYPFPCDKDKMRKDNKNQENINNEYEENNKEYYEEIIDKYENLEYKNQEYYEERKENNEKDEQNNNNKVNIKNKNTKQKRKLHFDIPDDLKITFKLDKNTDLDFDFTSRIDFEIEKDGKNYIDLWYEKLDKLKLFIDTNKKTPSKISKNEDEKKLGIWLRKQKQNYKKEKESMSLNDKRRNIFEKFKEEYKEYLLSCDELWYENLDKLKLFINTNKKTPSERSKSEDEKQLGSWLRNQKINYKKEKNSMSLKDKRRNIFEKFQEEYKEYLLSGDEIWYDNLDKLKLFINTNKKTPSCHYKNEDEKKLGIWLGDQKRNYKKEIKAMSINDKRRNIFEDFQEEYKEYLLTYYEIWYENFNKLKLFINTNKKTPSHHSKNEDEKQIGGWLDNQKRNYKKEIQAMSINDKRRNIFEDFQEEYKEYILTFEDIWYENFNKLKLFINTNKKTPSRYSKNEDEKQLGGWLGSQKVNYKKEKNSMSLLNDNRRNIFEEFITEYKEYFQDFELNIIKKENEIQIKENKEDKQVIDKIFTENELDTLNLTKLKEIAKEHKIPNYSRMKQENKDELLKLLKEKLNISVTQIKANEVTNNIQNKTNKNEEQNEEKLQYSLSQTYQQKNMEKFQPKIVNNHDKSETKTSNKITKKQLSKISELHKKYKTMSSENLSKYFRENDGENWKEYHKLIELNEKTYEENKIPVNQVIKYLETKKNKKIKKVADLGCGLARIYKHFQNKDHKFTFVNIDHFVPENQKEYCIQGNIKNTELEDEEIDYSVLCLSLWGSDYKKYLSEIHRILDIQGELIIVEPSRRWVTEDANTKEIKNELKLLLEKNKFKIKQIQDQEKFMFIVCEKL